MPTIIDYLIEKKRIRALREIAHQQYQTSRGYAHLSIMLSAEAVINKGISQLEKDLRSSHGSLSKVQLEMSNQLQKTLEKHIVMTRLQEVPGIGPQLSSRILVNVFHGHIRDLKYASASVPGIGESKQYLINGWVDHYVTHLPTLMQRPFPGKEEVIDSANRKNKEILDSIYKIQEKKSSLLIQQRTIKTWISELEKVKENDFLSAILSPATMEKDLVSFQKGIFADWEPIPDWFKEICESASRGNV